MDKEELKLWIKKNLFNIKNHLSSERLKSKWFFKRNFAPIYDEITSKTSFLDENSYLSERIYCILNDVQSIILCKTCNTTPVRFKKFSKGYYSFCTLSCSSSNKEIQQKIMTTNIRKYGHTRPYFNELIKEKIRNTNLERYGFENPAQSTIIKNKIENSNILKYGVNNFSKLQINPESRKILENKEILQEKYQKKNSEELAIELDVSPSTIINYLNKHEIKIKDPGFSRKEKEISEFIKYLTESVAENDRTIIFPNELDIYIQKNNLAIEFDGLFWHSYNSAENKFQKEKHLTKTIKCLDKGIQLLHIFENEWTNPIKQDIWKSIISSKLNKNNKIYARKCKIKEISDNKLIKLFLDENHIQGHVGSSIKLGLYFNDELVSLMTFGKSRYNKKYQYELVRFCNKKYNNIIGGASKLFKYFINNYNPESIISYADLRYSNGNMYTKLDMKYTRNSNPNYYYTYGNKLYSRLRFQKHKLHKVLDKFDPELSESQNMFNNNYRRIWDCGNMVFIWKNMKS
jgi:DNA-binding CsgD family transcriptional regulator